MNDEELSVEELSGLLWLHCPDDVRTTIHTHDNALRARAKRAEALLAEATCQIQVLSANEDLALKQAVEAQALAERRGEAIRQALVQLERDTSPTLAGVANYLVYIRQAITLLRAADVEPSEAGE